MVDLEPFTSWRDRVLMRPYSIGAWTIATDGSIAVVVPRLADAPEGIGPDILHLFVRRPRAWLRPPPVSLPLVAGMASDLGCSVSLPWGVFARRYVRAIWGLPDVEISPGSTPFAAMAFRFSSGSGEGLVMPLRSQYPRNIAISVAEAA